MTIRFQNTNAQKGRILENLQRSSVKIRSFAFGMQFRRAVLCRHSTTAVHNSCFTGLFTLLNSMAFTIHTLATRFHPHTAPLRFLDTGNATPAHAERPPILLLHGLCENLSIWDGFVYELAKEYRVLAMDMLGHVPEAALPAETAFTLRDMGMAAVEVLNAQSIERAVIVGHSMGGYAAMQVATHAPERLAGLCLFQSMPFADSDEAKANRTRQAALLRQGKPLPKGGHLRSDELDELVEALLKRIFAEQFAAEHLDVVQSTRAMMLQTPQHGFAAAIEAMREREDTSHVLPTLNVPVQFVLGAQDPIIPLERMLGLVPHLAHGLVSVIRHCAHEGMLEAPQECLQAIRFLASVAA